MSDCSRAQNSASWMAWELQDPWALLSLSLVPGPTLRPHTHAAVSSHCAALAPPDLTLRGPRRGDLCEKMLLCIQHLPNFLTEDAQYTPHQPTTVPRNRKVISLKELSDIDTCVTLSRELVTSILHNLD